ncbi:MAG: pyridoxal phosphate-dependent aminotransferase, partial [Chloroflexi bacterium]|nr:pyridoxal phosphate-dependent aminotransferase [Chloroflexota bacterium]
TSEPGGYRWDLEALERAVTPRTKLLMVHSPVNPTGVVLTIDELRQLAEIADRHDLLLVYDESYDRLVYDGRRHRSPAELPFARERLIVIQSFTKSFAMSPWRVGYLVAPLTLASHFGKLVEWELLMVSHVAQAAATAALTGPQDWLSGVAGAFQSNRDGLWSAVVENGELSALKPEGGPFLFISAPGLGLSGDRLRERLLNESGIPTEPGAFFGSSDHVRLSLGSPPDVITEAGELLRAFR